MFARRDTLVQALIDLETGGLPNAEIIVVSRGWWESLSTSEQTTFRTRADRAGVSTEPSKTGEEASSLLVGLCLQRAQLPPGPGERDSPISMVQASSGPRYSASVRHV
jgi:hypothetical protein